jgi:tetratricopeptide (TPR) repeat protein
MKICKSCGAPVAEGKNFCSACGAQVIDSQEKSSTGKNKRMLKTIISITVIIAILCIVIPLSLTFAKDTKVKSNINLGNKYLLEGKYEEAILVFEKVISVDKKNVDARLKLTELYLKTKRFDDANKVSIEILDIAPSDKEIYIKAADLMIKEGRRDDAVSYLKKVFEKTKDSIIEKKLEELRAAQTLSSMEVSIFQGETYNLPDKIKLNINNSEEEHPVKWTNPSVDTKTPGTYNFEGMVEEYDRKVRLILTVFPKDLFQASGKEVSMDKKQKEALDDYFTIFSNTWLKPFENSNISDEELIRFAASYIDWMEWNKVETNNGSSSGSIKSSDVDEKCIYYFGKKPSAHKSIQDYNYSDGKYTYELAEGEAFVFSQADRLFDLGGNLYRVDISTYVGSSGFTGNIHASPSELLSGSYYDNENHADAGKKKIAIIKKVTENNTEVYPHILHASGQQHKCF